jgi:hypothetical protein
MAFYFFNVLRLFLVVGHCQPPHTMDTTLIEQLKAKWIVILVTSVRDYSVALKLEFPAYPDASFSRTK